MVGQLDEAFEGPETRAVPRSRENADQQLASLSLLFLQQRFNCRVLGWTGPERGRSRDVLDAEGLEHIEIAIDEMSGLYFFNRLRFEVREEVERTMRPA